MECEDVVKQLSVNTNFNKAYVQIDQQAKSWG